MARKKVLIAGASGLVGYAVLEEMVRRGGIAGEAVALSRRTPLALHGATHVALDLTDATAVEAALAPHHDATHLVYAALHEQPGLVAGWREQEQIAVNDRMLRNVLGPLLAHAKGLRHVTLLQGTKAYGVHVRPIPVPAREGRDEMRQQANFYWQQEDFLREAQRGRDWHFTILRPVLIVGVSTGSAMNVIPAFGAYAALRKLDGQHDLPFPGGAPRVAQAVHADLLARAILWAGEAESARNETFNVTNGDVFVWPLVWPAIARALGMEPGPHAPMSLERTLRPRCADWDRVRREYGLAAPDLEAFVGLSFEYADYTMGHGRTEPGPPAIVSTIKLQQAGFHEVMDTEAMFVDSIRAMQARRLLPAPT
jgi:nucleoside-diphosphate-sugar epimerase